MFVFGHGKVKLLLGFKFFAVVQLRVKFSLDAIYGIEGPL